MGQSCLTSLGSQSTLSEPRTTLPRLAPIALLDMAPGDQRTDSSYPPRPFLLTATDDQQMGGSHPHSPPGQQPR